jgi:formate--tetrahydrofolate ligase
MKDIEIAQSVEMRPIGDVARAAGIDPDRIEFYGRYKAKLPLSLLGEEGPDGKLILVTAINPTPAGEGKTTTTIGLADGMRRLGKKAVVALREPSLGPVFGMKGGAAGGGWAQVVPMEDINLHFTGDFHAIGAANNLLAALIDNHIQQGNALGIDPRAVSWRRCVDMNDRQLREIVSGLGGRANGTPREDGFDITVASEVMAILCLSGSLSDMKARFSRIVVGYTFAGSPVTAGDLNAAGAMCALMRDAMKPNLVQTLEGNPALVHGGPFANIAHGCNSVMATKMALKLGDYAITEAGFGADLGAEKFMDIKCRAAGLTPAAVVVVATVRALKHHGGAGRKNSKFTPMEQLSRGIPNLMRHVSNMKDVFGMGCVVAINRFPDDLPEELAFVEEACEKAGVKAIVSNVWAEGGRGAEELAQEVIRLCDEKADFRFAYESEGSISDKLRAIATKVYGARGVQLTAEAKRMERKLTEFGFGNLPVCVAKTQYSFSDDPKKLGAPEDFEITVRALRISAGAGFVVALTGDILTMPGLPKTPAAEGIDIDAEGKITGLF